MSVYTLTIAKADERHTPSLRLGNGALARFCAAAVSSRPKQEADGKGAFLALLLVSPWRPRLLASGRGGCARKDRHTMYGGQDVAPAAEAIARRSPPGSRPKRARTGRRWAGSRPLIYCVRSSPPCRKGRCVPASRQKREWCYYLLFLQLQFQLPLSVSTRLLEWPCSTLSHSKAVVPSVPCCQPGTRQGSPIQTIKMCRDGRSGDDEGCFGLPSSPATAHSGGRVRTQHNHNHNHGR